MTLLRIVEVVVDSADVPAAVAFHKSAFGMEVLDGAADSPDGVLLGVAGAPSGRLRLVPGGEATMPPPQAWDYGARLLGLYSRSLDLTSKQIRDSGGLSREPVSYPYGAATLKELVGRGTDGVWWTIPEVSGDNHRSSPALDGDPQRLHSELHSAVLVVEDHDAAVKLFVDAGMRVLFDGTMTGADFERLVGMPVGAALRIAFLVGADEEPARLEIMSFTGVQAEDRTNESIGIRRLVFAAVDPGSSRAALLAGGARELPNGKLEGPAGVEIALVGERR